jgi:hypothetical protein
MPGMSHDEIVDAIRKPTSPLRSKKAWGALLVLVACNHPTPAPPSVAAPSVSPAVASSTSLTPAPTPCERLVALALPHVAVTEARATPASAASPEGSPALPVSCMVHGVSRPTADSEIRFEVVIPAGEAWNGRYLQVGNGGFAGAIPERTILRRVSEGYAAAGTDDGHRGDPLDASWALGHPEKVKDFGYRALKETTDAALAIVLAYTGRAPAHSYFLGCSDGGREALMEAQRYPDDFDGIVAGAPANHWTHLFDGAVWAEQAILRTPESYLPASKLPALEAAALAACGDEDKVIEDPLACHFDPGVLRCKGADNDRCLTDAQITAVRSIYAGPRVPATSTPLIPGYEPGSEAEDGGWQEWLVGKAPGAAGGAEMHQFAQGFFRYVVFADPTYDIRRFRFDVDVATTDAKLGPILNSYDTDLGAFRKHGGKLIQYHGWGDAAIPPRDSIDYYQGVQTKMGDTSAFYRLFMAPGMLHCGGGTGPDVLATLPAITDWVESAKAPDQLLATRMSGEGANAHVVRTRPLCPYPLQARWDGKGDRKRAESFGCGASTALAFTP